MKKKDYKTDIHEFFKKVRSSIEVRSLSQILRMEMIEEMEKNALEENSREALRDAKAHFNSFKKKTYVFPLAGKKYTILRSGNIKETTLTQVLAK